MIIILILLIPLAGVLIISTLMYNVKPEALTDDVDKAKIKIVTSDKNEDPNVREQMLNDRDYYVANAGAYTDAYTRKLDLSQAQSQVNYPELKTVDIPPILKPSVPMFKDITA